MIYVIIFLTLILLIAIYKTFINVKEVSECCNAEVIKWNLITLQDTCLKCGKSCQTKLIVKFKNKWYERS